MHGISGAPKHEHVAVKDIIFNGLNMFYRLAREAGLEYVEMQNLTEFYDDNR